MKQINIIQKKCWCGESITIPVYSGTWIGKTAIKFSIGECIGCKTMRTTYSEKEIVDYNEEDIYEETWTKTLCST